MTKAYVGTMQAVSQFKDNSNIIIVHCYVWMKAQYVSG